jgi:hypothetical protein
VLERLVSLIRQDVPPAKDFYDQLLGAIAAVNAGRKGAGQAPGFFVSPRPASSQEPFEWKTSNRLKRGEPAREFLPKVQGCLHISF